MTHLQHPIHPSIQDHAFSASSHQDNGCLPKMVGNPVNGPPPPPLAPAMTPQQRQQQQQYQQHQQHQRAVLHHQQLMLHEHQNHPVRTLDLRDEMPVTKERAREELSSYVMFRFEKADEESDEHSRYGSDSHQSRSWLRVTRSLVLGLQKEDIAREIRNLNRDTRPVAEKKATLNSAQQRHIEATLEEQRLRDSDLFETNLVQLDYYIRGKKKDRDSRHGHHDSHRRASKPTRVGVIELLLLSDKGHKKAKHGRHGTSSHKISRSEKVQERTSITAYFKTSPRPEVDVLQLYFRDKANKQASDPAHQQQIFNPPFVEVIHQEEEHYPAQFVQPQRQNPPAQRPQAQHPQAQHPQAQHPQGQRPQGQHPQGQRPPSQVGFVQLNSGNQASGRSKSHSPRREQQSRNASKSRSRSRPPTPHDPPSPETSHSSVFSVQDDASSVSSPGPSDSETSRDRGRSPRCHHARKPSIPHRQGGFHECRFGIETLPRGQHPRFGEHRSSDFAGGRRVDTEPMIDIEKVRENAYALGRADEREDTRALVEDIALATATLPRGRGYEHSYLPARVVRLRPTVRELEDRFGTLGAEEDGLSDGDWGDDDDLGVPVYRVPPPPLRRGSAGVFRGGGVSHVLRREVEDELEKREWEWGGERERERIPRGIPSYAATRGVSRDGEGEGPLFGRQREESCVRMSPGAVNADAGFAGLGSRNPFSPRR